MKKKIRIKLSGTVSVVRLMAALGELSADVDAESVGGTVDIHIHGSREEIKSVERKIREIAKGIMSGTGEMEG